MLTRVSDTSMSPIASLPKWTVPLWTLRRLHPLTDRANNAISPRESSINIPNYNQKLNLKRSKQNVLWFQSCQSYWVNLWFNAYNRGNQWSEHKLPSLLFYSFKTSVSEIKLCNNQSLTSKVLSVFECTRLRRLFNVCLLHVIFVPIGGMTHNVRR